jgi:hypothetical protein
MSPSTEFIITFPDAANAQLIMPPSLQSKRYPELVGTPPNVLIFGAVALALNNDGPWF